MSCFLPSSVIVKSDGFNPLMGSPFLPLADTSTTTNCVVAANFAAPSGGVAGCVWLLCCGGGCAEATSNPLKSVAISARIIVKSLEPETQRGRNAAQIALFMLC